MSDFVGLSSGRPLDPRAIISPVEFGSDDRMVVWFFRKSLQHAVKSEQAGRPIFEGHDFVHIQHPGERDFVERPAMQTDQERWPRKWAAYQGQRSQDIEGTPLATLFPNEPEIVDMMRALHIHTTEQLERLSEPALDQIGMGARAWVEKARRFNEAAKAMAPVHGVQAELDAEKEKVRLLTETVSGLKSQLDELSSQQKKGK